MKSISARLKASRRTRSQILGSALLGAYREERGLLLKIWFRQPGIYPAADKLHFRLLSLPCEWDLIASVPGWRSGDAAREDANDGLGAALNVCFWPIGTHRK
jgi:hypothetical protein